jgi:hypothetical protein
VDEVKDIDKDIIPGPTDWQVSISGREQPIVTGKLQSSKAIRGPSRQCCVRDCTNRGDLNAYSVMASP